MEVFRPRSTHKHMREGTHIHTNISLLLSPYPDLCVLPSSNLQSFLSCHLLLNVGVNEPPVLARNTEHQALSQTCWIRTCMLTGSSSNSHPQSSLESTGLVPWEWEFLFVHFGDLRKLRHSRYTGWRKKQVSDCTCFKWNSKLMMWYKVGEGQERHPRSKLTPLNFVLN